MASRRGSTARRASMRSSMRTRSPRPTRASSSTPRTASTAKPATSRIRRRTSSGSRPKAAAARTIRTCKKPLQPAHPGESRDERSRGATICPLAGAGETVKGRGMIASRSRLLAASLTVLALALAQGATAQDMGPASAPANPSDTHPPAVILEPDQVQEAAPCEDDPEAGAPQPPDGDVPPHIVIADAPAEPAIPEVWAPVPLNAQGRSAYGLYLAGKLALMTGEGAKGADWLAQAAALTPEQPRVREEAFTSALLSGDLDVAGRLAPTADAAPAFIEIGRLISAVQTFVHGDARAANAALVARPIAAPHSRAGLMVAPWVAAAAGDWTRALAAPPAQGAVPTLAFARQNRA